MSITKVTIELPSIISVPCTKGATVYSVATDKMPLNSIVLAALHGFKQLVNDAHSGITAKSHPDTGVRAVAAKKEADKVWSALCAGTYVGRSGQLDVVAVTNARVAQMTDEEFAELVAMRAARQPSQPKLVANKK